ncbi:MAG: LmbE family protein [Deltaproteobacteria bacterium]|nr:LmbE family protein [Deltaproteobacteria bacterium]
MLNLSFGNRPSMTILCLGAHCDDIEIGCGGAVLKYIREIKEVKVHWVVFSSDARREKEASACAREFLEPARDKHIAIHRFRNSFFPYCGGEIKECFEKLKEAVTPDIIFTHCGGDAHQDHRIINELTWNTFRNHLILEYEIAKYDADLRSPNAFIHLDEATCREKVRLIMKHFISQSDKMWFTEDLFLSVMRIRGMESNSPSGYAEGYYCRKFSL